MAKQKKSETKGTTKTNTKTNKKKIEIESFKGIMDKIKECGKLDDKTLEYFEYALKNNCVETKNDSNNKNNSKDMETVVDNLNQGVLNLCIKRTEVIEQYKQMYNNNVVQKIKETLLYKHSSNKTDDHEKYVLHFAMKDMCGFEKISELPSALSTIRKVKDIIDSTNDKVAREVTNDAYIKGYFNGLYE